MSPSPDSVADVLGLIPAHDEAPRIGPVVEDARVHLEVVVVDDGSTDGTAIAARAAGASVVGLPENRGKGAALRAGFRHALERGFRATLCLDGDGQHDPGEIPSFLAAWRKSGADLVIGARDFGGMPPARRLANTLGRRTLAWALGQDVPDNQSGYRLVGARLMRVMLESDDPGFGFEVETVVVSVRRGWPVVWVPIRTIYGDEASHINPLTHFLRFARLSWRVRTSRRR